MHKTAAQAQQKASEKASESKIKTNNKIFDYLCIDVHCTLSHE